MIRIFRKHQKTVGGILILIVAAFVISSFGVDLAYRDQRAELQKAFTVDGVVVSKSDLQRKIRQSESQYRKMFGTQYDQLVKQFGINVPQNVLDGMIDAAVIDKKLDAEGFAASDSEVREAILEQFPGGYDPSALISSGTTPAAFLKEVESEAKRKQLYDILTDASLATDAEKKALYLKEESKYKVQYASFSPNKFESLVKAPTDEELLTFFQDNQEQYRTTPKASFNFISFHPEEYLSQIEIPQDEVEFYYTDNQNEFKNPESLDLQHIQILFPKDNDPAKLAAAREKATMVLGKAKAGEDFKSLALQYSDDVTSKFQAGKLGWVPRGRYPANFDEKTFTKKEGGIADLIEVDYGFHIVKVNGYREASVKPLNEVQAGIITKLKNEQAPAIADAAAREFFDKFLSGDTSLSQLAQDAKIPVHSSGMIEETGSVTGMPKEVVGKIFSAIPEVKQFVEDKKSAFIIELTDQKESEIPDLASIKDAVLKSYKVAESQKLAKNSADEFLKEIQAGKTFAESAKVHNAEIKMLDGVKSIEQNPILGSEDIKAEVFEATSLPSKPSRVFFNDNAFLVFTTLEKKDANIAEATSEELKTLTEKTREDNIEKFRKLLVDSLKNSSKIDVSPSVIDEL